MKQIICAALVLLSGTAYGQLFKCVDKSGRVEYASVCPSGTSQQDTGIRTSPSSAAPAAAPQKSLAERDAEFRKHQIEQQEALAKEQKKAAQDQQRQRDCDQARAYLKSLEARNRVARTDPKTGERVYLEENDYLKAIAETQRTISANCQ